MKDHKPFDIAIMIGWYAGLRISETFGLTWNDINLDSKTITINKQIVKRNFGTDIRKAFKEKGKKEERSAWYFQSPKTPTSNRTIVVSNDLIKVLKAWKKKQLENQIYYGGYYKELYLKEEKDEKGKTIQRIIEIEKSIFSELTPQQSDMLLELNKKYLYCFKQKLNEIT